MSWLGSAMFSSVFGMENQGQEQPPRADSRPGQSVVFDWTVVLIRSHNSGAGIDSLRVPLEFQQFVDSLKVSLT